MRKLLVALVALLSLSACEDGPVDTSLESAPSAPPACKVQSYDYGLHGFKYLCKFGEYHSLAWMTPDGDYIRRGCFTEDMETCSEIEPRFDERDM